MCLLSQSWKCYRCLGSQTSHCEVKELITRRILICLLPILTPLFASGATLYRAVEPVRGRYVVILNDTHRGNVTSIADEFARTRSIRVGFRYESLIYGFSFSGTEEAAQRIANDPRVK